MTFQDAVSKVGAPVNSAFRSGKKALGRDSGKILTTGGSFTGSIDLDTALYRSVHAKSNRWDYGLGYKLGKTEQAVWLEVHPARDGEVSAMVKKLAWIQGWLRNNAKDLESLTNGSIANSFFWAATNGVHMSRNSPQARKLAASGMAFPRNVIRLR